MITDEQKKDTQYLIDLVLKYGETIERQLMIDYHGRRWKNNWKFS